eukprot:scaffold910_cov396-Prasinococcus_capsulatus_cf.AAC.77
MVASAGHSRSTSVFVEPAKARARARLVARGPCSPTQCGRKYPSPMRRWQSSRPTPVRQVRHVPATG